ncbi:MAG: MBL fold metallo-hydrolase [Lachnospiraceae bacterium]|nr:MBL fold metallo-hydrolase [Lachnospiraceae bacterium]
MITSEFKTEKVSERITRIFAFSTELMYLVEGENQAALLDSGSGIGFVKPLIDRLTYKPVTVLLTHGHVDHAMGASEFPAENVYINQDDAYIYEKHCTWEFRKGGLGMMPGGDQVTEEDFTPVVPIADWNDLKEGDRFDLGGISVEIYACPGHTRGSLVMLLPEERTVLLGDACNGFTFLFQDYSTTVEEYRESLCRLKRKLDGKFDKVLASHGDGVLSPEVIKDNIRVCDQILAGETDDLPMEFGGDKGLRALENVQPGHGNIIYNPARIRRE